MSSLEPLRPDLEEPLDVVGEDVDEEEEDATGGYGFAAALLRSRLVCVVGPVVGELFCCCPEEWEAVRRPRGLDIKVFCTNLAPSHADLSQTFSFSSHGTNGPVVCLCVIAN